MIGRISSCFLILSAVVVSLACTSAGREHEDRDRGSIPTLSSEQAVTNLRSCLSQDYLYRWSNNGKCLLLVPIVTRRDYVEIRVNPDVKSCPEEAAEKPVYDRFRVFRRHTRVEGWSSSANAWQHVPSCGGEAEHESEPDPKL